jgi:Tfp pilus assembly protein PilF
MRSSWEKAIELKPDVVSARERLFTYYLVAPGIAGGDMDKALMLAGEVVKLNPVRGHLLLGRYYQKSEEMAKAEQEYMTAVRLDSTNVNTINTIGYFYLNRDEPQKALPWFTRYVKLAPDAPNAYDSRGDCFVKNGQPDSALVMFKIALSKDPQFEPSLYKQAKMLKRLGRRAEARTACALYLKQYPDGRYAEEIKSLFEEK